jgi:hypothetical protein
MRFLVLSAFWLLVLVSVGTARASDCDFTAEKQKSLQRPVAPNAP